MSERKYIPGVYLLKKRGGGGDSPVIYFNGESWWLPGWELEMKIGDAAGLDVAEDMIGELIWTDHEKCKEIGTQGKSQ